MQSQFYASHFNAKSDQYQQPNYRQWDLNNVNYSHVSSSQKKRTNATTSSFHDQYTLCDLIGQGANGSVYLVRRKRDGIMFAAKCFVDLGLSHERSSSTSLHESNSSQGLSHDQLKEIFAYSQLQSPHTACLADIVVNMNPPTINLVLPLSTYGNMNTAIFRSIDDESFFSRQGPGIILQMARGLQHMHLKSLIHCDIKPANMLLFSLESQLKSVKRMDPYDETRQVSVLVQITDMGSSMLCEGGSMEDSTMKMRTTGLLQDQLTTSYYRAPEIWLRNQVGVASDVWSLGMCILQLISGVYPMAYFCRVANVDINDEYMYPLAIVIALTGILEDDVSSLLTYISRAHAHQSKRSRTYYSTIEIPTRVVIRRDFTSQGSSNTFDELLTKQRQVVTENILTFFQQCPFFSVAF